MDQWSSLSHIKKKLNESNSQELVRWHEVKTQERESSRQRLYVPWIKGKINDVVGNKSKKYTSRYFQLKVGHGAIGAYLAMIGVFETPQCWWWGQAE